MDVEIDHGITVGFGRNFVYVEDEKISCFDECLLYSMKIK